MTTVAIHQPNYAPWLGYFQKIAQSDIFVFLDDVQFSKGSYINRVQILSSSVSRWITQPVSVSLGVPICSVEIVQENWTSSHLEILKTAYGKAEAFSDVWPEIEEIYNDLNGNNLASVNLTLTVRLAENLGIAIRAVRSSEIEIGELSGDDRLIAIVKEIAPYGTYLSGRGGKKYQDPKKFSAADINLTFTDFEHPQYPQGRDAFIPGLSVLDAVFHLGWRGTSELLLT